MADNRKARRTEALERVHTANRLQNDNIEEHDREPQRAKITDSRIHRHSVARIDADFDIRALGATKRDVPHTEWLCFVAMEFGMVEGARGIMRWHPGALEPVERDLTFAEVATFYRLTEDTVQQYDRRVRRTYSRHLANGKRAGNTNG